MYILYVYIGEVPHTLTILSLYWCIVRCLCMPNGIFQVIWNVLRAIEDTFLSRPVSPPAWYSHRPVFLGVVTMLVCNWWNHFVSQVLLFGNFTFSHSWPGEPTTNPLRSCCRQKSTWLARQRHTRPSKGICLSSQIQWCYSEFFVPANQHLDAIMEVDRRDMAFISPRHVVKPE